MTNAALTKRMWMVRSDAGRHFAEFQQAGCVAIGWPELGDVKPAEAKSALIVRLEVASDHLKPGGLQSGASQVLRFLNEPKIGDDVVTYDPSQRVYAVGTITSGAIFDEQRFNGELPGILRAMGYKTQISPSGPDRGKASWRGNGCARCAELPRWPAQG